MKYASVAGDVLVVDFWIGFSGDVVNANVGQFWKCRIFN
jgi:hypothetical protein